MRSLLILGAAAVFVTTYATLTGAQTVVIVAALAFAAIAIGVLAVVNFQTHAGLTALRRQNAAWFALMFGWGGATLAAGYGLTPLYWQHWWQYALAMALLAAIALGARSLAVAHESAAIRLTLTAMTALQGLAAGAGLIFLVTSGKLGRAKPDWLANDVFLAGGIAIALGSLIALIGQRRASA